MAATFAASYDLVTASSFRIMVEGAIVTAAINIATEATDSQMAITYWAQRRQLSVQVLASPDAWIGQFAWAVAVQTSITTSSVDSDIQTAVNSVWAAVAGAGPAPS